MQDVSYNTDLLKKVNFRSSGLSNCPFIIIEPCNRVPVCIYVDQFSFNNYKLPFLLVCCLRRLLPLQTVVTHKNVEQKCLLNQRDHRFLLTFIWPLIQFIKVLPASICFSAFTLFISWVSQLCTGILGSHLQHCFYFE